MMVETALGGLNASDPLGFLAALGTLRIIASEAPSTGLRWELRGEWHAVLGTPSGLDPVDTIWADVERWRRGHPAIDFAVDADRKIQDLKHPPSEFRMLMMRLRDDPEAASFIAAYATGVAVDGTGQTKPTSLHFTAGQQRFMDAVLAALDELSRSDIVEALQGPWTPRPGKNLRWQASSERSRALLSYDPGKEKPSAVVGAVWLAFQGMPMLPVAPRGRRRVITTGFIGRGKNEAFTWPVWKEHFDCDETRVALSLENLGDMSHSERAARGISQVFRAEVMRSSQGYGNFAAARPV